MKAEELKEILQCGETTTIQFKQEFTTQKDIAKEMVAFANTRGGKILFGVKDTTGDLIGLTYEDIQTISRELGNTANEQVRPTIYIDTEVVKYNQKRIFTNPLQTLYKPFTNPLQILYKPLTNAAFRPIETDRRK